MESKHEKFIRLAELRVNNALKAIELISNLANTRNYAYTEDEASKVIRTLKAAVNDVERQFKGKGSNTFKF